MGNERLSFCSFTGDDCFTVATSGARSVGGSSRVGIRVRNLGERVGKVALYVSSTSGACGVDNLGIIGTFSPFSCISVILCGPTGKFTGTGYVIGSSLGRPLGYSGDFGITCCSSSAVSVVGSGSIITGVNCCFSSSSRRHRSLRGKRGLAVCYCASNTGVASRCDLCLTESDGRFRIANLKRCTAGAAALGSRRLRHFGDGNASCLGARFTSCDKCNSTGFINTCITSLGSGDDDSDFRGSLHLICSCDCDC